MNSVNVTGTPKSMSAFFLTVLLFAQGIPISARQAGVVTGVLRNAEGTPVAGMRVAAMAREDGANGGTALVSLAETDQLGRYRLENIPPGQYYVVAGRVDLPTYYPGTAKDSSATMLKIAPNETVTGIDFAIQDSSVRPLYIGATNAETIVKANIRATGQNARFPVFSAAGEVTLEFTRLMDGAITAVPLTAPVVNLAVSVSPPGVEFQIRVRNLPPGYSVKSITRGPIDLTSEPLKIATGNQASLLSTLGVPGVPTSVGINIPNSALGLGGAMIGPSRMLFISQLALAEDLIVTIAAAASSSVEAGVRVTGMGRRSDTHPVYMSGRAGIVFSDGSFEFRQVPPGRHTIATVDYPGRALGAALVVGDRDIENVELDEIAATPADIRIPREPEPAEGFAPASKLRQPTIRGRVRYETGEPVQSGKVFISGFRSPWYQLDEEGRFEIPHILPGTYNLEIQISGYADIRREIRVGIDDMVFDLQATKQP